MRRGLCDGQAFLPAAEAEHRRRPNSTAAQPIPVSGKLAPPCLGASQAWAQEGTKLLCTDLQQHGEATAEGMIAVLPFAGNFSSGQAAAATHSACYIPSVQIHVGMSRLPLVRCLGASPTMWSQRPETLHTPRCKHSSQLHAGQGQHVSVVAACLPVAGCRPPSPQCGMADGDPSPCKQVDVQWETRGTRCAVTSVNKTRRPLIRAGCAGSSDSSDSMPIGVAARFSPAAVEGEQPSRSSWCEFRSPAMGAAEPERRMVLARCETWAIDDGELQRFTGNMMGRQVGTRGRRWSPRSWCQQRQALARQGVAHHEGHATGTPTAGLVEVTAANEPRRQEHSCIALCKYLCVCCRIWKEEEHREAHQHSKRHSWPAAVNAVRSRHQQSRTVVAHTKAKK
ncbi:hypothetical protein TCDM_09976 [Trypanosoma cruzi Dm28c]|uniref:Uncharacterized protein n=1 Tax=Trypanosoma cruzi Dm28c TaxID=1416333 RepID=V5BD68_TRYCR|nr:hypothetical protein TCDM_09976 [Trypanosoma cruzi Dm28c]